MVWASHILSPLRVPNSLTGQVLEARPDFSVQVDVNDWT